MFVAGHRGDVLLDRDVTEHNWRARKGGNCGLRLLRKALGDPEYSHRLWNLYDDQVIRPAGVTSRFARGRCNRWWSVSRTGAHSPTDGTNRWAALLFGILLVLLVLIMAWLLRAIAPAEPSTNVTIVVTPPPPSLPAPADPTPAVIASLVAELAETERLRAQLSALDEEFRRKAERCKAIGSSQPSRPSSPLPADRRSQKDLGLLQGCWTLSREAGSVRGQVDKLYRENCTTKVGRICVDANGRGRREQTMSCPSAGTISCTAPVTAQFGPDGSFTASQPDVDCQRGAPTKWNGRTLSCRRIDDERASCRDSGRPELGIPAQEQEFRRAP